MRSSKSRSRSKNRSNNRSPANNINRVFDSSGPEGKVRGTPQQIIDKYTQLARDAFLAGDRVAGENFQQHAEHYTRLLSEAQRDAEEKRLQNDQQNRDRQQQQQKQRDRDDQRDRGRDTTDDQPYEAEDDTLATAVVDFGEPDTGAVGDSGLVETPEEQPKKKPARPRKPRAPKVPKGEAAPTEAGNTGEAPTPPDTSEAAAG